MCEVGLGDEAARHAAHLIRVSDTLTRLSLCNNGIGTLGMATLGMCIHCACMRTLCSTCTCNMHMHMHMSHVHAHVHCMCTAFALLEDIVCPRRVCTALALHVHGRRGARD